MLASNNITPLAFILDCVGEEGGSLGVLSKRRVCWVGMRALSESPRSHVVKTVRLLFGFLRDYFWLAFGPLPALQSPPLRRCSGSCRTNLGVVPVHV